MDIVFMGNDKYISLAGSEGLYKQIMKQIGKVGWSQIITDIETPAKYQTVSYEQQRKLILLLILELKG